MKVLVTGGAGFIGSHIVDQLTAAGHEVTVLDRHRPEERNEDAVYHRCDILDAQSWDDALKGVDAVCHQAAKVGVGEPGDVLGFVADNDLGTALMLWTMAKQKFTGRLVLASSMTVYGEGAYACPEHGTVRPLPRTEQAMRAGNFDPSCPRCGEPVYSVLTMETDVTDPLTVYAATKLHQEHICRVTGRRIGVPVCALRYHNVYGPRMPKDSLYTGVASVWRSQILKGEAPQVFEDGRQRRDFVHVNDVARANVLALTGDEPIDEALNVASGEPTTVLDMARSLSIEMGGQEPRVTGKWRAGDVRHIVASPARAEALLGFKAGAVLV